MGLQRLDISGVTGPLDRKAQIAAQRRAERHQKKAAMLSAIGAIGGFAISGGNPLGAAIGSQAGGALAGQSPNVPGLIQTGVALQDRSQQQEAQAADQAARQEAALQLQGTQGQEFFDPDTGGLTEEIGGTPPDLRGALSTLLPTRLGGAALSGIVSLQGRQAAGRRQIAKDVSGRQRDVQTGELVFPEAREPERPEGKRRIIKDAAGFQRFADTGKRVFPDVKKPPPKPSTVGVLRDRRIQGLVARGLTVNEATDVTDGNAKIETTTQGRTLYTNLVTRETREITPIAAPEPGQVDQTGAQQAPPPTRSEGALAQFADTTSRAATPSGRPPTLWEAAGDAAGILPVMEEIWAGIIGQFPGMPVPERATTARTQFRQLSRELFKTLALSDRFPVREFEQIKEEFKILPGVWDSEATTKIALRTLDGNLDRRITNEMAAARNTQLTDRVRGNARRAANAMTNFRKVIGVPSGDPQVQGQPAPQRRQEDASRLFNVDTTGMTLPELKAHRAKLEALSERGFQ